MTGFDYTVLLVVGSSVLLGLLRGAIREVCALAGWAVAFLAARAYTPSLAAVLPASLPGGALRYIIAWVLLFFGVLLATGLVTLLAVQLVHGIGLGWLDKGLGVAFGCARGTLIVLVLVLAAGLTSLPQRPFWRHARLSSPLVAAANHLKHLLPGDLSKRIQFE